MVDAGAEDRRGPRATSLGGWLVSLLAGLLVVAGCGRQESGIELVPRHDRFGIFRDLILFLRPADQGGPFFLDRFESTAADFAAWRDAGSAGSVPAVGSALGTASASEPVPDLQPQAGVDLREARRFARWRFCRLPRADEWLYACTNGGSYVYPWGEKFIETRANTGRLGLNKPTPVGAFQSGRSADGPFDLVGNVAEWTETVLVPFVHEVHTQVRVDEVLGLPEWPRVQAPLAPAGDRIRAWPVEPRRALPAGLRVWLPLWTPLPAQWLRGAADDRWEFEFTEYHWEDRTLEVLDMPGVDTFLRTPGLRCWLPAWTPAPTDWLVMADSSELERQVLGGHFRSRVVEDNTLPAARSWLPGSSDPTTGVRLGADPEGLVIALLEYDGAGLGVAARQSLLRFLRRPAHRQVLRDAYPRARRTVARPGELGALLAAELGGG